MNRLYFAFVILLSFVYVSSYIQEDIEQCYRQLGSTTSDADTQLQFCIEQVQMNCSSFKWSPMNVVYESPKQSGANNLIIPRTRKEYRLLSNQERYDFLRSLYLLKQDTRLSPNVFDSIAFLHTGDTARNAHAGPTFLLWHRIYLRILEDALREKVPGVTIPFWDPTLDSHLPNPRDSIMWSDELMGTINGFVTKGPFANWKTPIGYLVRNGGFSTRLPTSSNIEDVLTRTKLEEISEPNAEDRYNLESMHNSMHVAIGGHMARVPSSPMDPVFWLLHSYVELVHTRFTENQRRHNVNPATDYPSNYGLNVYAPNQSIGLMNLTVAEALKNTSSYTHFYKYDYSYLKNCTLDPKTATIPGAVPLRNDVDVKMEINNLAEKVVPIMLFVTLVVTIRGLVATVEEMNRLYFAFVILLSFVYVSSYIQEDIKECYSQLNIGGDADTQLQFCIEQRLSPNVFDSIAFLHTGDTARNAHAGPTFLLWHRIYLRILEDALREKVPGVTIPFWDPTLDSHLPNPRDSTMWSDELMGTINGFVTKGPFANWKTPIGYLVRNGGFSTRLPTSSNIEDVLTRTKLEEISEPNAEDRYNLESMHNSMHVAIGGHMARVPSSPMDPVFWLLHSYVELVHTRFTENQRRHNVNPATDYPSNYGLNVYAPNQSIGLMNLTVAEALKNTSSYTHFYKYDYSYLKNCTLDPKTATIPGAVPLRNDVDVKMEINNLAEKVVPIMLFVTLVVTIRCLVATVEGLKSPLESVFMDTANTKQYSH
ncbi:tyrosinase tyr-1 [Octopus vulgaris]|uniref:Tyrosinase tyr-1 n=1 Tax=Octopus vulgaris TaxID=6645 RepID=A0AA36APU2_OCTVU|nr:tyrosinase tyr-1 [Octopus vulgaris]